MVILLLELLLSIPVSLGAFMTSGPSPLPGATGVIAGSVLPLRRAEQLISTLPGVLSVRVVPGETGAIDEVHVLTTNAVPPKATVRNIESALIAELGLRVNHRKISVATTLDAPRATDAPPAAAPPDVAAAAPAIAASGAGAIGAAGSGVAGPGIAAVPFGAVPDGTASAERAADVRSGPARGPEAVRGVAPLSAVGFSAGTAREGRSVGGGLTAAEGRRLLIFEDVEVRRSRTKGVLCRVTINRDGEQYVGDAEGQESERSRVELAARATVAAITQAVTASAGGERSLSLEGAKRIDAFDREFIFVSVAARLGREMVVLTGSCEVRESAETSAVLSVLDATNRWVHLER